MGNPFEDEKIPDWITPNMLEGHQNLVGAHKAGNINMFSDNVDSLSQKLPKGTITTPQKLKTRKI